MWPNFKIDKKKYADLYLVEFSRKWTNGNCCKLLINKWFKRVKSFNLLLDERLIVDKNILFDNKFINYSETF